MTDREATRVGSYSNSIVLSDDENDGGSDSKSYTSLDMKIRRVLQVGIPDSDDEVIQEFDHARGQTRKDMYNAIMRTVLGGESDFESEEDEDNEDF